MTSSDNFVIKTYNSDPNIDFDQAQADIYNDVTVPFVGGTVKAADLKARTLRDKFDPNGMFFAFSSDGKPLAYVRYHFYPSSNELYIGYPWAVSSCPSEVQERLFNNLKSYVKEKYPNINTAYMGYADDRIEPFHEFASKKGFEKDDWYNNYHLSVQTFGQLDLGEFLIREANDNDLSLLIYVALRDSQLSTAMSKDQLAIYFKEKVLKDGNAVFLFKDDHVIGATAALRNYQPNLTLARFQAIDKEYEQYRYYIFIALAKLLLQKGITDQDIVASPDKSQEELIKLFEKHNAKKKSSSSRYKVKL